MDKIYSLKELSADIKSVLEIGFSDVKVKGEVVQPKRHSSGHLYFTIKDGESILDCIAWRTARLIFEPTEGSTVVCRGKVSTYCGRSKYQMIVTEVSYFGIGELMRIIAERKKKLLDEGLFDREKKPPLPKYPKIIGIATSPTGAVIHDMMHRLRDRYPCGVILYPITVQGEKTPSEAIQAIRYFSTNPVDLIILARGGGSFEDLFGFNDEELVRTVAASKIPIITAIGHETDTTLVDYASTLRAPTPTAAIELCTPNQAFLLKSVTDFADKIHAYFNQALVQKRKSLTYAATALNIQSILDFANQRSYYATQDMNQVMQTYLRILGHKIRSFVLCAPDVSGHKSKLAQQNASISDSFINLVAINRAKLTGIKQLLKTLSYKDTLKRGFCRAFAPTIGSIKSKTKALEVKSFSLEFADGTIPIDLLTK
jgi:exodeoxyribonuclease VII large subunit